MLGSPNFYYGITNGSSGPENIKDGSSQLQKLAEQYFHGNDAEFDLTSFGGRSDHASFIPYGVPVVAFATGAEGTKFES
jgi:Zn-dependent M28 family amino/carboxypeptidase